jgi:hypothetical protein
MKRLFALYVVVILTAASNCYASLASMYNIDVRAFPSNYDGGRCVTVYQPSGGGVVYVLNGRSVEAAYSCGTAGRVWNPSRVAQVLTNALDRPGQSWVHTRDDKYGGIEWATNDGRMYAKLFWYGGNVHTLRICYTAHLTELGLLKNYSSRSKARAKAKVQRRELLPPVEES